MVVVVNKQAKILELLLLLQERSSHNCNVLLNMSELVLPLLDLLKVFLVGLGGAILQITIHNFILN